MTVDQNQLAEVLDNFLNGEKTPVDFAWTRKIDNRPIMKSFIVEGLGEIAVPVSEQDLLRLKSIAKRAPFGRGANLVVDTTVREAWQIEALKVSASSLPPDAFGVTVPKLVSLSLAALGLDAGTVGFQIHLYSMLLYEAGGHFVKHLGSEKELGMFASLILQIPVEGGHQGGIHNIEFDGRMASFDCSIDSDQSFHSSIFLVNCQRELELITSGWRVEFVFNLVWKRSIPIGVTPERLPGFLRTVRSAQSMLSSWTKQSSPRLLAVPLKCKYNPETLLFAGFKVQDRMIFDIFNAIGIVQIHLAVLTKHQTGSAREGPLAKHRRTSRSSPPPEQYYKIIEQIHTEEYETSNWRKVDGRPAKFFQLEIECHTELVGNIEDIFPPDAQPDREECGMYYSSTGPQPRVDHWFHQSVLVIWPKQRSISMACEYGFDGALELIERTFQASKRNKESSLGQLREVLSFCKLSPERVWIDQQDPYAPRTEGPGIRVRRMMKLCTRLKAIEEGLVLLNLISTDFPKNQVETSAPFGHYLNRPRRNSTFYEGIQSDGAAGAVAEFIRLAGWQRCSSYVDQLVCCSRATFQIAGFANLAIHLLNYDCVPAAISIANKTTDFLFADGGALFREHDTAVCSILMAMFMEGKDESKNRERISMFVKHATVLELTVLGQVIVCIGKKHGTVVKKTTTSLELFKNLCSNLLDRDIHSAAKSLEDSIVDIMSLMLWLEDSSLLQKFVMRCTSPNCSQGKNNLLLQKLSNCRPLRTTCLTTVDGKKAICDLVSARIAELEALEAPVFSWSQSEAVFAPEHPTVEAFLRSPNESMVYTSQFNGIQHARNFAERFFNENSLVYGYSADTEVSGTGKASKCKITKNRRLYEYMVDVYDLRRTELVKLQSFISRQCKAVSESRERDVDSVSFPVVDDPIPMPKKGIPELVPISVEFYPSSGDPNPLREALDVDVDSEPIESIDAIPETTSDMKDGLVVWKKPVDDPFPQLLLPEKIIEESQFSVAETSAVDQDIDDQRSPMSQLDQSSERDVVEGVAADSTHVLHLAADPSNGRIESSGSSCVVVEPVTDTVNGILLDGLFPDSVGDIQSISEVKEAIVDYRQSESQNSGESSSDPAESNKERASSDGSMKSPHLQLIQSTLVVGIHENVSGEIDQKIPAEQLQVKGN